MVIPAKTYTSHFGRRNNLPPYIPFQRVAMFAPWRSQKSERKRKDLITGNSFIHWNSLTTLFNNTTQLVKNLNPHQHGIIPDILRLADRLNRCKLNISMPHVVERCCGSLESQQVRLGHQGLTDVVTVFSTIRLIQNGQSNSSRKGPFQNAVIISLHHMNKQCHVFSNTAIYTV